MLHTMFCLVILLMHVFHSNPFSITILLPNVWQWSKTPYPIKTSSSSEENMTHLLTKTIQNINGLIVSLEIKAYVFLII